MSDLDRAIMEADKVDAEDAYFEARPILDSYVPRKTFNAGYECGWNDRNQQVQALQAKLDALMLKYCPHDMEPSCTELQQLWTAAMECEDIGEARAETLRELYEARMKKFTWIGSAENDLRFSIDAYLIHRGYFNPITTELDEGE